MKGEEKAVVLSPPCTVIHEIMPDVRRVLAHRLREAGMTQGSIAEALGITQAAVSNYLKDDDVRGEWYVEDLATSAQGRILAGEEPISSFCATCRRVLSSGSLCGIHGLEGCAYCLDFTTPERKAVLEDLISAVNMLMQIDFGPYAPEVGINIASAQSDARDYGDVAAIPGRMRTYRGRIVGEYAPAFGGSKHLAAVLLAAGAGAVMNIRYPEGGDAKMESLGRVKVLNRADGRDASQLVEPGWDAIVDPGWVGIEPCIYVFGRSAGDVAGKVRKLVESG